MHQIFTVIILKLISVVVRLWIQILWMFPWGGRPRHWWDCFLHWLPQLWLASRCEEPQCAPKQNLQSYQPHLLWPQDTLWFYSKFFAISINPSIYINLCCPVFPMKLSYCCPYSLGDHYCTLFISIFLFNCYPYHSFIKAFPWPISIITSSF